MSSILMMLAVSWRPCAVDVPVCRARGFSMVGRCRPGLLSVYHAIVHGYWRGENCAQPGEMCES